jgi:hypothetical protein
MKTFRTILFILIAFLLPFAKSEAQQPTPATSSTLEVIQFHNEHRCVTCVQIEKLTKATLEKYFKGIPFTLVNVDDAKNAKKAEQFEAAGTALYLYNPKTGKKKDLTEFAFMKAFDEKKFEAELKKQIEDFIKS